MSASRPVPSRDRGVVATLVLDTDASSRALGLRDAGGSDRRLLFSAPGAHIEIRVPRPAARGEDPPWMYGQFVPVHGTAGIPTRVTLTDAAGAETCVEAGSAGDFAIPCDPTQPFTLRCEHPHLERVLVRYAP